MGSGSNQTEEDVANDPHTADSRADAHGEGAYVGRKASDDAIDADETGGEARAKEHSRDRRSPATIDGLHRGVLGAFAS